MRFCHSKDGLVTLIFSRKTYIFTFVLLFTLLDKITSTSKFRQCHWTSLNSFFLKFDGNKRGIGYLYFNRVSENPPTRVECLKQRT